MQSIKKNITIVGGGIAGMQTALQLHNLGFAITLLEKEAELGGRVANWANIFPQNTTGIALTSKMAKDILNNNITLQLSTEYQSHSAGKMDVKVVTNRGVLENQHALILASGFRQFNPAIKEELGYGIFQNIITATQLENALSNNEIAKYLANNNNTPNIAFVHCVGSRDRQIERNHCSKICCMVGVNQAIQMKQRFPLAKVTNFYMDLRMYDEGFEELYYEAQACHKINFVRGRVSEISEDLNKKLVLKAEDTLIRKPLIGTFDLVILLNGFEPTRIMETPPIFYTKSALSTTTIKEALTEANSLALEVTNFFKCTQNSDNDRVWICN